MKEDDLLLALIMTAIVTLLLGMGFDRYMDYKTVQVFVDAGYNQNSDGTWTKAPVYAPNYHEGR